MSSEIHAGDIGTLLVMTVKDAGVVVDLSTASAMTLYIKKPNGQVLEKTALLYTDGTDGKAKYTTVSGDIDTAGAYKLQMKIVFSSSTFFSSYTNLQVKCSIG